MNTAKQARTTTFQYDALGNLKKTILPDSTYTEKTYNSFNQVISDEDQAGVIVTALGDADRELGLHGPVELGRAAGAGAATAGRPFELDL